MDSSHEVQKKEYFKEVKMIDNFVRNHSDIDFSSSEQRLLNHGLGSYGR